MFCHLGFATQFVITGNNLFGVGTVARHLDHQPWTKAERRYLWIAHHILNGIPILLHRMMFSGRVCLVLPVVGNKLAHNVVLGH